MLRIPGVGPKRINVIYDQLKVTSLAELEQACKDDKVAHLPGFGKKTQDKILQGLEFLSEHSGRFLYDVAAAEAERIRAALVALRTPANDAIVSCILLLAAGARDGQRYRYGCQRG